MKPLGTGSVLLFATLTIAPFFAHAQEAQTIGKMAYQRYCAGCHGVTGKGDGPLADSLPEPPADLTQIQTKNGGRFPSNEVFDTIDGRKDVAAHRARAMPVWAKVYKEQETEAPPCEGTKCFYTKYWRGRIIAIITYIRTLQEKPHANGDREW